MASYPLEYLNSLAQNQYMQYQSNQRGALYGVKPTVTAMPLTNATYIKESKEPNKLLLLEDV